MSLVNDSHILEYICKLCNFPYLYDDRESLFTDIERLHSFLDKNTDRYNWSPYYSNGSVDEEKGNMKLNYPVGLITLDEVVYAGGVYHS